MDNKLIQGLWCSKGNQDWKQLRIGVNVEIFEQELQRLNPKARRGFINIDVCWSKDNTKLYAVLDDYKPKEEITSSEQSPDREDLPF